MDRVSKQIFIFVDFSFSPGEKIDGDECSAVGCPGTDLSDLNTYFSQYVLEKSNASNYFNVYVAGFSLAPETSMTTGNNATESTVWYSNQVNMTLKQFSPSLLIAVQSTTLLSTVLLLHGSSHIKITC